jgi:hypothetical protein
MLIREEVAPPATREPMGWSPFPFCFVGLPACWWDVEVTAVVLVLMLALHVVRMTQAAKKAKKAQRLRPDGDSFVIPFFSWPAKRQDHECKRAAKQK